MASKIVRSLLSRTVDLQKSLVRLQSTAAAAASSNTKPSTSPADIPTTFLADDLEIQTSTEEMRHPKPDPNQLVFGAHFADHMFEVEYHDERGWGKPLISPIHNLVMHPGAKVLHYAIQLFEGMKAYRGYDGKIRLFRPDLNMKRLLASAARISLPSFDPIQLQRCIERLVAVDHDWVPDSTSSTLYIRPTFIGTDPTLGVAHSRSALLFVITGPVGPYFPTGFKPVSLLADPAYVRASPGGCGAYKLGANYAPTIWVHAEAVQKHHCQQVLWLYGPDHELTEVGTMNLFVFWVNKSGKRELITPPLSTGIILPGVTRQSLLELAQGWGEFEVHERQVFMRDVIKALDEGRMLEMFGAGTACVVCPIEAIVYQGQRLEVPTMKTGAELTMRLHKTLTDIQFGRTPSDWTVVVNENY